MTDAERDRYLLQIVSDIAEIKVKVNNDYAALYGNGKPGLLEDVKNITQKVAVLEERQQEHNKHTGMIAGIIGFIINAAIALWAAIRNHIGE